MRWIADMASPVLLMAIPLLFIIGSAVIILFEGCILRLLRWNSFGRSVKDSLIMNALSTFLGLICSLLLSTQIQRISPLLILAIGFALSVVVEGLVLYSRRRENEPRRAWLAAVAVNLGSYALLAFIVSQYIAGIAMGWAFIIFVVLLMPTTPAGREDALKQQAAKPGQ